MCNAELFKEGEEAVYEEEGSRVRVLIVENVNDQANQQHCCKLKVLEILCPPRMGLPAPEIGAILEVSEYTGAPGVYVGGWRLERLQEHV